MQVIGHHLEHIVVQREEVEAGRERRDLRRGKAPIAQIVFLKYIHSAPPKGPPQIFLNFT